MHPLRASKADEFKLWRIQSQYSRYKVSELRFATIHACALATDCVARKSAWLLRVCGGSHASALAGAPGRGLAIEFRAMFCPRAASGRVVIIQGSVASFTGARRRLPQDAWGRQAQAPLGSAAPHASAGGGALQGFFFGVALEQGRGGGPEESALSRIGRSVPRGGGGVILGLSLSFESSPRFCLFCDFLSIPFFRACEAFAPNGAN